MPEIQKKLWRYFLIVKHSSLIKLGLILQNPKVQFLFKHPKRTLLYVFLVLFIIILLIPVITYIIFASDLQDKDRIINTNNTGLTLLDQDGKPFFEFNHPKSITYVPIANIPQALQNAVISSEDRNFYTNQGFSLQGIFRAFFVDIFSGSIQQGGSTITQELVKNSLLNSSRNFLRKYQEVVLAYELNRRYSKKDILEMYMNSVYFGEGAFGIENAAEAYFSKPTGSLDLAQSALLAGILPAPSSLSPLVNLSGAQKEQRLVLDQMVAQKYITEEQAKKAESEKLVFKPKKEDINLLAPHFALMVENELIKKYGEEYVLRSGLIVKTTLNSTWQAYAEQTVQSQVLRLAVDKVTNGAVVVMDPRTGEIEALVGSHDWNDPKNGKINMAVSPRQPGSSFKPIIYAYGLSQHLITPASILQDVQTTFPGEYKPHDYDYKYRGPVTVRRALANSLNIPAVELMQEVGVANGVNFAQKMGITTLSDPSHYGLSYVLGAAEVPLVEMTNVYATFANHGMLDPPTDILEIQDKYNKVIYTYTPNPKQVVGEDVSYLISSILSDNNARAEEFDGALTINFPAAVKTGTTEDFRDALTFGYTPDLTVGVWVGNNDNSPMDNIAGSLGAAPIWRLLMDKFALDLTRELFTQPSSVVKSQVCITTTINNVATTSAYMEYFLSGTQPKNSCISPTPTPKPTTKPSDTPAPIQPSESAPTDTPTNTPQFTPTLEVPINTPSPTETPATPTTPVTSTIALPTP